MRNRCWLNVAGHSLGSKQDSPCVRSRTFLVFEAGHSLCSTQDILCVANKTSLMFQSQKMHLPLFGEFGRSSQDLCESCIRFAQIPGRSSEFAQKWRINFSNFKRLKNREDSSDLDDFWTKSIAPTQSKFRKIFAPSKKFSRRRRRRRGVATNERTNERTNVALHC